MTKRTRLYSLVSVLFLVALLSACVSNTESIDPDALAAITDPPAERQQILDIEEWKDNRGANPVWLYVVVPATGELLFSTACRGVPGSSTESTEPNEAYATGYSSYTNYGFRIPNADGRQVYSPEQMGRDGTYGDPVPFRQCLSPEGNYYDVPPQFAIVSSVPLTFPMAGVAIDAALLARQLEAEQAVKDGFCLNDDLSIRECDARDTNATDEPTN